MNIIMIIIAHIAPSIEALIWYRIMTNMLDKKYQKKYYIIAAILILILLYIKMAVFSISAISNLRVIGTLITVTYTFIAGILLFKNTFFEKFIWWGIYYIGLFLMELLAVVLVPMMTGITLKEIQTNATINFWLSISTKIAALLAFELLIRIRKSKLQININSYKNLKILITFNIILFLGCVIVYFNLFNEQVNVEILVRFFFGVVIITFWLPLL